MQDFPINYVTKKIEEIIQLRIQEALMQEGYKYSQRDKNHTEIKKEFERLGWSVAETHSVKRFVDLVVGKYNITLLVEVKQEGKKLTKDQEQWHDAWRGTAPVVMRSVEDVQELDADIMQRAKGWLNC